MGEEQRKYEKEYKVEAVKLAKEIGASKAAKELGIRVDTLYGWQKAVREGRLDALPGSRMPDAAMSLAEEVAAPRKQVKALEREKRRLKEEERVCGGGERFFRRQPSQVSKEQRMRFLAEKTDGGVKKGKLSLYCRVVKVSRQGFYQYLARRERPWKYQGLAEAIRAIVDEDICNDTYGRKRMYSRSASPTALPRRTGRPGSQTIC